MRRSTGKLYRTTKLTVKQLFSPIHTYIEKTPKSRYGRYFGTRGQG